MKNWESQLSLISEKSWTDAIIYMESVVEELPNDKIAHVNLLFLIVYFLIHGDYTLEEHDIYTIKLQEYHKKSYHKFSTDNEYLFFLSVLISISEWHFEVTDLSTSQVIIEQLNDKTDNTLYKWWLSKKNMDSKDLKTQTRYLESKGLLGIYIIGLMNSNT